MSGDADLTVKQEAFACAYFETGNAAEAYRQAYDVAENARDSWIYVEASQLLDHPKIALRLDELREQAQRLSIYNVFEASKEYERAREIAEKLENPAAMVSAIGGKVKLFGLEPPAKRSHTHSAPDGGPIQTEETGQGAAKLAAFLGSIAERGGE